MCGIAGGVGFEPGQGRTERMLREMTRRGPDGEGIWTDGREVEIGHRRLAIIDLTTGQQPQVSPDGRWVLSLNGEIYNYPELRPDLERRGWVFRTTSDTEVLLAGLALKGPDFIRETIGMFAFALWDNREKSLLLARDRMGIKPLYYTEPQAGRLAFASELKALLTLPEQQRRLNPEAVDAFLALRYVPGPSTMVQGIQKFPPGHWAFFRDGRLTFNRYWSVQFDSYGSSSAADERELTDRFSELLQDAVRLCMRADVSCGAFLSSGVDSSTVAGLMTRTSAHPVRTYTIGFDASGDETGDAERIAQGLGSVHTTVRMTEGDLARLPEMVRAMDEPFADPIALAMYRLAERAGRDVKVVLTGEGADEILAGYVHHPHFLAVQNGLGRIPNFLLKTAAMGVKLVPVGLLDRAFDYPASLGERGRSRLADFVSVLNRRPEGYLTYVSLFGERERRTVLTPEFGARLAQTSALSASIGEALKRAAGTDIDRIFDVEYQTWLPDNILFKQDRMLMAHSVEGRVPFCDHRLVEFCAGLPMRYKQGQGTNKRILRTSAARLFKDQTPRVRKKAFMVPADGTWGLGQAEVARRVLLGERCRKRGLFRESEIRRLLDERESSPLLVGKQLMCLTMLELWMEHVFEN